MFPTRLKKFEHPHSVYQLDYPAHWDEVIQKDGESCGFGPHDRDDIGLWISILPVSLDTDGIGEFLPKMMEDATKKHEVRNPRPDASLKHQGIVADSNEEGQGGHFWLVAGGDVVLFASTQVPTAERDSWNPYFQQMMASLQITRDDHLIMRKVANDLLAKLRERYPEEEFDFDENTIRGKGQVVYLSNIYREVRSAPEKREEIIKRFVDSIGLRAEAKIGEETWEDARTCIVPVLKPRGYIREEGPTKHLLTTEWLADVLICYVIQSKKLVRFVTGWDLRRWGTDAGALHQLALENLGKLPWPNQLMGARSKGAGRLIIVDTDDSIASSRLLHPELYRIFSGPLGSPFLAGIPCRNRLVLYSDQRGMKNRIARQLKKDHDSSAYPITPRPFLVTRDGIALAPGK